MDWYLCKCFGKLKEYSQTKKQNRNNLRKARFFYLQKLFKKSFQSLKALELQPYKRYWFNKLKEHHFTIRNKEELIKTGHDRLIMKESFVSWFMLQKENENYNYLIHSMLQFYTLRLKARALKAFEYNQYFNIKLREHDYTRKLNKKRKSFLLWKAFCGHQKLKKLDKGRAYEYYYFSLLKKGFYQWMPSCRKIREEAEMAKLKKKFFNLWKKLYQSNETAKTKAVTTLRRQILKKVTMKLWKMHTWFEKRTKIASSFFLYRRFMGWKLAVSKMAYSKEQKQKANVWYKWKIERKYFEKFCVNHKKESRISKEYKIKVYQFQKKSGRALLDRYFRALKQALMIRHVEIVRNDKLLTTFFSRWARMTYQNKLKRQKKRGYTKRMRMAKLFTSFEALKTNWLAYKRKELIAKNFHHFWKLRKAFKIWMAIKVYEERHRELRADHQYCLRLLQNGFYGLHLFNQSKKQQLKFEEKLDWYIEKKIRILLKKILRKLYIWAKANIKYREHNTAFLYHVFYNFKLNCKLNRLT